MSCDVILTPYKRINTSSGAIGYAAQFKKPVIATGGGLLGKLVNKYHLGVLISDVSGESIADGIRRFESWHYRNNSYLEKNNIPVTIRNSMGADISGACGQLRRSVSKG